MSSLFGSLLAVQGESPTLPKDKTNPHFNSRFTGLDTIVETVGPILNKHGLVWVTLPSYNEDTGAPELEYRLVHAESGERIEGRMPLLLGKNDSQSMGSALTYARRYALAAVLNLVADDDDDGNAASGPAPRAASGRRPSEKQLAFLGKVLNGQAHGMVAPVRAQLTALGFTVEDGWTSRLSGAQVSDLLDRAKEGNWPPDPGPPSSDVPNDFPAAPTVDTDGVPFS
jgi:hypothetical protein